MAEETATTVPAATEKPAEGTAQAQAVQEAPATLGFDPSKFGYTPEQAGEVLAYAKQIESAGGLDKLMREASLDKAVEIIERMKTTPEGRQKLAEYAGVAQQESEDLLSPEEKRVRKLETELASLRAEMKQGGKASEQAYEEAKSVQDQLRWQSELKDFYKEQPEARELHQEMWPDLMEAIEANPQKFGGPGWVKNAAKHWYSKANSISTKLGGMKAKGRVDANSGAKTASIKPPEQMTKDEMREETYRVMGLK